MEKIRTSEIGSRNKIIVNTVSLKNHFINEIFWQHKNAAAKCSSRVEEIKKIIKIKVMLFVVRGF